MAFLILAAVVAYSLFAAKSTSPEGAGTALELRGLAVAQRIAEIKAIIGGKNLAGMSPDAVYLMADMEQGISAGMLTAAFIATNSLFNRHQGNGHVGVPNSDGYWTGIIHFQSVADPNLRVYSDLGQSVDDFVSLMQNPLYARALSAAQAGDIPGFISAVADVPYSAQDGYEVALTRRARGLGMAV